MNPHLNAGIEMISTGNIKSIQTYKHAYDNIDEMKTLLKTIKNPCNTKLVFQSLPKHMRRRAMSHQLKRLPKRYQLIHAFQMRKCGKYVRTESNKNKSKKFNIHKKLRLRTHNWHAKRFRMVHKWGFKIPFSAYEKSYRASYRASTKSSLMLDISYYNCIEVIGYVEVINEKFKQLTNPNTGLGICAKTFVSGKREGCVTLFKKGNYPRGALGDIQFFWKPEENFEAKRTIWIWIHPSNYSEILEEIIKLFDLKKESNLKFENNKYNYNIFQNNDINLALIEHKNSFNRFRLIGPLSQQILSKSLKSKFSSNNFERNWFSEAMSNDLNAKINDLKTSFWINFSRDFVYSNMIISINVEDPRINRFKQNTLISNDLENLSFSDSTLCNSFLWNSNIRFELNKTIMENFKYITVRNKTLLISKYKTRAEIKLAPVPVILIQSPGSNICGKLGYNCGWDVIVPKSYGMIFWLSLISCGAKAGGLRETHYIMKECWKDIFLPDTPSGKKEAAEFSLALKQRHFSLPPSKRCNYKKLSITSPFKAPLKQLIREWNLLRTVDFYILRDKCTLLNIINFVNGRDLFPKLECDCLIQIIVEVKMRGNPGELSIVCIPEKVDLQKINYAGPVHTEPLKKDDKESERRTLRFNHSKLLKRLKKAKKSEIKNKQICFRINESSKLNIISTQHNRMAELWVSKNPETVRYQCTREVIGYVTQSHYSLLSSKVNCIAYVTANGLKKLLESIDYASKVILLRGTKTRNYRFAKFEVNLNV